MLAKEFSLVEFKYISGYNLQHINYLFNVYEGQEQNHHCRRAC